METIGDGIISEIKPCKGKLPADRIRDAAPALLESLQKLSAAYELLCHQIDENPNVNMHYRSAIAAIAAVKGE